jgi:hypothetical protein
MYRVTRKQLIRQGGNVIGFEDSCDFETLASADHCHMRLLIAEIQQGYQWYGPDKVIFESPTFYRSVQATIEEIK